MPNTLAMNLASAFVAVLAAFAFVALVAALGGLNMTITPLIAGVIMTVTFQRARREGGL